MHILRLKLALPACVLLTLLLVGSASANRLSRSEMRFRRTYPLLGIESTEHRTVVCDITLEGSYHGRTSAKTRGALIGYVNVARVESCNPSNSMRFNTETLPWHIQYEGFSGALPSISRLTENMINMSLEATGEAFGIRVTCHYTIASEPEIYNREPLGVLASQNLGGELHPSSTFGCPEGRFVLSGLGEIRTPGGGNISVILI